MSDKFNYQMVVIDTMRGTARSERELKKVWQARLKSVAPHYRIVGVKIGENQGDDR